MRVFSASIETFLRKLNLYAKEILRQDFGVQVERTRFHTPDGWTWPIVLVAIDDRQLLGYFNHADCTIGINKCLMYTAKDRVIKDLLRHELAHYFTFIRHPESAVDCTAHGAEFRATCDAYGLGPEIRRATMEVRRHNDAIEGELRNEKVIERFRKLMSLSESDNENEAALAIVRANELMVKHNLDARAIARADDEIEYCVRLVIPCKRKTPRITAIGEILREFLVYPVHAAEGLEVTGTRDNVENAEYIAQYLDRELAAAWKRARVASRRRALKQKPFMIALSNSYRAKLVAATRRLPDRDRKTLVVMNQQLEWACNGAYGGGLRSASSSYEPCAESSARGAAAGSDLDVRRGLNSRGVVKLLPR